MPRFDTDDSVPNRFTSTIAALAIALAACGQSGSGVSPTTDGGRAATIVRDTEAGPKLYDDGSTPDGSGLSDTDGAPGSAVADSGPSGTAKSGAGRLDLVIAGTTQGTDYAVLKVVGKATLGGELHLTFGTSFTPQSGHKFVVVTAAGGVMGTFASITTNGVAVTPGQDATTFYVTVN